MNDTDTTKLLLDSYREYSKMLKAAIFDLHDIEREFISDMTEAVLSSIARATLIICVVICAATWIILVFD